MKSRWTAVFAILALGGLGADAADQSWEGQWSAPSLSRPEIPLIITLEPGGKATETVGDFVGAGTWTMEGHSVRILWDSEWINILRPAVRGGHELATWKKGTPPDGTPDDVQPVRRIASSVP